MAKNLLMSKLGIGAFAPPAPVPKMPEGLVHLMEELSRDVLRNNPSEEDLYQFCADHMWKLLNLRGVSEGRKPLSLEQKIKRAQERVRQKSEQHRRKFDEYLKQLPLFTDGKESEPFDSYQDKESQMKSIEEEGCGINSSVLELDKADNDAENIQKDEHQEFHNKQQIDDKVKVEQAITEKDQASVEETSDHIDKGTVSDIHDPEFKDTEIKKIEGSYYVLNDEHFETSDSGEEDCTSEQFGDTLKHGTIQELENHVSENHPNANLNIELGSKVKKSESISTSSEIPQSETKIMTTAETVNFDTTEESTDMYTVGDTFQENIDIKDDVKVGTELTISNEVNMSKPEVDIVTTSDEVKIKNPGVDNLIVEEVTTAVEEKYDENTAITLNATNSNALNISLSGDEVKYNNMEKETEPLKSEPTFIIKGSEKFVDEEKFDRSIEEKTNSVDQYESQNINISKEMDISEIENTSLTKSPEIIDEDSLKESEVIIVTKSNSNDQEVNLISVNTFEHLALLNGEKDDADRIDIDINAIARSDSVKEESNETVSDSNTANDGEEITQPSMDLETAAVTIQKVFRTFMFKSRANTLDDAICNGESLDASYPPEDMCLNEGVNLLKTEDECHALNMIERRPLGLTRMDTVLQTVNEEKSLSLSDDSSISSAATIIQAHVRGFLVRNKLHSDKTTSLNSLVNSDDHSKSLEVDNEPKNKTVLNIHIVPEGGHYMSRDESMAMSLDLPYDNSPPSWGPSTSLNLHPLSERRKQLKREDAVQSISPPSNNSGKLSEDVESVKDMTVNSIEVASNAENSIIETLVGDTNEKIVQASTENEPTSGETTPTQSVTCETVIEVIRENEENAIERKSTLTKIHADETDVVTKDEISDKKASSVDTDNTSRLFHSGEFHDLVLPTNVSRADSSVVREFKNVVVKYLLWNNS